MLGLAVCTRVKKLIKRISKNGLPKIGDHHRGRGAHLRLARGRVEEGVEATNSDLRRKLHAKNDEGLGMGNESIVSRLNSGTSTKKKEGNGKCGDSHPGIVAQLRGPTA